MESYSNIIEKIKLYNSNPDKLSSYLNNTTDDFINENKFIDKGFILDIINKFGKLNYAGDILNRWFINSNNLDISKFNNKANYLFLLNLDNYTNVIKNIIDKDTKKTYFLNKCIMDFYYEYNYFIKNKSYINKYIEEIIINLNPAFYIFNNKYNDFVSLLDTKLTKEYAFDVGDSIEINTFISIISELNDYMYLHLNINTLLEKIIIVDLQTTLDLYNDLDSIRNLFIKNIDIDFINTTIYAVSRLLLETYQDNDMDKEYIRNLKLIISSLYKYHPNFKNNNLTEYSKIKNIIFLINEIIHYLNNIYNINFTYLINNINNEYCNDLIPENILNNNDLEKYNESIENILSQIKINNNNIAMEAKTDNLQKSSTSVSTKIVSGYKTFNENIDEVDQQLTKVAKNIGKFITDKEDIDTILIEGKKWTIFGIVKKIIKGIGIFNYSKIGFIMLQIYKWTNKASTTSKAKKKMIMLLEEELEIITEKIDDARGDNNRKAKYALMRSKKEIENAIKRIKYNMGAEVSTKSVSKIIEKSHNGGRL